MSTSLPSAFACPACRAKYKVIGIEASEPVALYSEIKCVRCGGPLPDRAGPLLLKYFLVEGPGRRNRGKGFHVLRLSSSLCKNYEFLPKE